MQVSSENLLESPPKPDQAGGNHRENQAMAVRRPTLDQLRSVAEDLGMQMGDEGFKSYDTLMQANYAAYDIADAMRDYVPAGKDPRTPGTRPEGQETRSNA